MRRIDRQVTEPEQIRQILDQCKVCRIAMQDEEGLYIVPLNFAYQWDGELTLYFHSAKEGRKLDAFRKNPSVAFEMDCSHQLIEAEKPCSFSFLYASLVGTGKAEMVENVAEKIEALEKLMLHQSGKAFSFDEKMANTVAVFKIRVSSFSGKAHL